MGAVLAIAALLVWFGVGWFVMLHWLRRRLVYLRDDIMTACARDPEEILMPPTSALFQGPGVRGNGVLCVTERRLLFRKALGGPIDVPLSEISGARESGNFRGRVAFGTGAKSHLVIRLGNGNEVGFLVKDAKNWVSAIGRPMAE